jgi:methylglutamate dehydrogenase subunit B
MGSRDYLARPDGAEWSDAWDAYLHRRANVAGPTRDLWYHEAGCGAWLVIERDTVTHDIAGAVLASEAGA